MERTADFWLPHAAGAALFGALADSRISYDAGGSVWVPARPEQHEQRGLRFPASGTPEQLQQVATRLLTQCSQLSGALQDPLCRQTLQWWYTGPDQAHLGPFNTQHLQQFSSSGMCPPELLIGHGGCGVWLPLWLVLQLAGLQAAPPPPPALLGGQAEAAGAAGASQHLQQRQQQQQQPTRAQPQQPPQQQRRRPAAATPAAAAAAAADAVRTATPERAATRRLQAATGGSSDDDDDYGSGGGGGAAAAAWRRKVLAEMAAAKAQGQQQQQQRRPAAKPHHAQRAPPPASAPRASGQAQGTRSPGDSRSGGGSSWGDDDFDDADMTEAAPLGAVLEALAELRSDQHWLDELSRAVAMDIDEPLPGSSSSAGPAGQGPLHGALAAAAAAVARAVEAAAAGGGGAEPGSAALSAVDLPALAATGGDMGGGGTHAAPGLLQLVLVLDTNVLVDSEGLHLLRLLQRLQDAHAGAIPLAALPSSGSSLQQRDAASGGAEDGTAAAAACVLRVHALVPWTVLMELDKLKLRDGGVADRARRAVRFLQGVLGVGQQGAGAPRSSTGGPGAAMLSVQSLQVGRMSGRAVVPKLVCCAALWGSSRAWLAGCVPGHQGGSGMSRGVSKGVVGSIVRQSTNARVHLVLPWLPLLPRPLLPQDFRQAAHTCDLGVPSNMLVGDDFILQCALAQQQQQQLAAGVAGSGQAGVLLLSSDHIMQLKAKANGMAAASLSELHLPPAPPVAASVAAATAPPGLISRLLQLSGLGTPEQQSIQGIGGHPEHPHPGGQQQAAVSTSALGALTAQQQQQPQPSPPPSATLKQQQQQRRQQQPQERAECVYSTCAAVTQHLRALRLALSDQLLLWLVAEFAELWMDVVIEKPPWTELTFIEVLHKHWSSTFEARLHATPGRRTRQLRASVDYLLHIAKRVAQNRLRGLHNTAQLPANVGVRVLELMQAFGADAAAAQLEVQMAGKSSTTAAARAAAAAVAAVMAAPAAADTAGGTEADMEQGDATAHAATPAGVQQQQQHVSAPQQLPEQQQQQWVLPQGHTSQSQQLHQVSHSSSSSSSPARSPWAAAAAAVPAPQVVGPCLRLAQLLQYCVALLAAVLPQLAHQLAAAAAAAGAGAGAGHAGGGAGAACVAAAVTIEQQLRLVVQHLEGVGQCVANQHAQQQQQQQQLGLLGSGEAEVMQLGLLAVQLCSSLLADAAAGAAVSQQLHAHAADFVAEAVGYLLQRQQQQGEAQQPAGPGVMLQQLAAALQHVRGVLGQAAHLANQGLLPHVTP